MRQFDILIIGAGAAGLTLALDLADKYSVAVLSKTRLQEGSSYYAQGGVAAVSAGSAIDSYESHISDTLNAGRGLCEPKVVEFVVKNARDAIDWLIDIGVEFTKEVDGSGEYHLTKEGGHSHRRIWHTADATGKMLKNTLDQAVKKHKNITVFEYAVAIDLIADPNNKNGCVGAYVFNADTNQVVRFIAKKTVLATGGASRAYLYSTNPAVSSGDGIAMAYRAGCRVKNLEFNQFHPTCLFHKDENSFLISEVLRGEGALLRLPNGRRFMPDYDPLAELAPRDTVARAIDDQMKRHGLECVYLDITHKSKEFIQQAFPTIYQKCLSLNIDITQQWIPVVPAAHYTCGGVMTDLNAQTDLDNLYAIGEVACTGLHGANRMASNSLLECLVFAHAAAKHIDLNINEIGFADPVPAEWDESQVIASDQEVLVMHSWEELRRTMWDYVGIVRSDQRLVYAEKRINLLKKEVQEYYSQFQVTRDLIELRNLVQVAELIIQAAQARKENIGLHFNTDYVSRKK